MFVVKKTYPLGPKKMSLESCLPHKYSTYVWVQTESKGNYHSLSLLTGINISKGHLDMRHICKS